MDDSNRLTIRKQLIDRKTKLERALTSFSDDAQLERLLDEVDAALTRISDGTFGLCETCHEAIESDRLMTDPVIRFCIDHLSVDQQRALEEDLSLAAEIQKELLPPQSLHVPGWETEYHYEGAGPVSGDYCDLLAIDDNLYFIVGDISGKGVAASMLMAHLHATLRSLVSLNLSLEQIMERASRMFCESTLPTHFATLVLGKTTSTGEVAICNAGHNPPLLVHASSLELLEATALPIGMFCDEHFTVNTKRLAPSEFIFLYTDGLSEAFNELDEEYGMKKIEDILIQHTESSPKELLSVFIHNLQDFRGSAPKNDDLTLMVIRRSEEID